MAKRVRKAVFPVAGLGTRFLPVTKAMPKEMLPVVDKPLIQYAFEEAEAAGIEEYYFVTGRAKNAIEDHFDTAAELEMTLRERGKDDLLNELEAIVPTPGRIAYTRQQRPLGLGHAVWCARHPAGGEIQLTDGLDKLISDGQPFHGLRAAARRYDCGEKLGYLEANLALGLQHPEFGDALRKLMKTYL